MSLMQIVPSIEKPLITNLSTQIFGEPQRDDIGYLLYVGETAIGIANLSINSDKSIVKSVGILKEYRGNGYGDFLTRAILSTLKDVSNSVEIAYKSQYFLDLGFKDNGQTMFATSENIKFPKKCCQ